jgi:hypothetical protein
LLTSTPLQEESVALELSERSAWNRSTATVAPLVDARGNPMSEHTLELREWLAHLEDWVETQLVATRALVALLDDGNVADCIIEQNALDAQST